jgi:hypothetical protein
MLGGGDQLYCDPVWALPALGGFGTIAANKERVAAPYTEEMAEQVVTRQIFVKDLLECLSCLVHCTTMRL